MESPHFLVQPGRPKPPTPSRAKPAKPLPKKRKDPRRKAAGHVVAGQKLRPIVTDRAYLDGLREEPCVFTGLRGTADDPVEPMHVGNPGKNLKSDNEALPARHSIHDATHRDGITAVLDHLANKPDLLLAMLRAYARERYQLNRGQG
jgi:hypothetical protein